MRSRGISLWWQRGAPFTVADLLSGEPDAHPLRSPSPHSAGEAVPGDVGRPLLDAASSKVVTVKVLDLGRSWGLVALWRPGSCVLALGRIADARMPDTGPAGATIWAWRWNEGVEVGRIARIDRALVGNAALRTSARELASIRSGRPSRADEPVRRPEATSGLVCRWRRADGDNFLAASPFGH